MAGGINQYAYAGNNPGLLTDPFGLNPNPWNPAPRNPYPSDHWILNGLQNTASDFIGGIAQQGWTLGDPCASNAERFFARLGLASAVAGPLVEGLGAAVEGAEA